MQSLRRWYPLMFFTSLNAVMAEDFTDVTPMTRLRHAKKVLEAAFAHEGADDLSLVAEGFDHLQHFGHFIARVGSAGWQGVLLDDEGAVEYELTISDKEAVQQYADESVFLFGDLLPLVLLPDEAFSNALQNELEHPALRFQRLVHALRWSWWSLLAPGASFWAVPFFGALANLARRCRGHDLADAAADPYRDVVLARIAALDKDDHPFQGVGPHVSVLSAPLTSTTFSLPLAYKRTCAWLSVAWGRSEIEAAERAFKSHELTSLRVILQHAAEWPIFDLLRVIASNADALQETSSCDTTGAEHSSNINEPTGLQHSIADGRTARVSANPLTGWQRLSSEEAVELYRLVFIFGQLCDRLGVRWWVSHGTLLGALRDSGLSLHADDCEVDVPASDVEGLQSQAMRAALARNGYELSFDPRGRCFKVWPAGSAQARDVGDSIDTGAGDGQLQDQTWWLPQERVGTPSLDVYIVETPRVGGGTDSHYVSNAAFHCNDKVCTQVWRSGELESLRKVPFGLSHVLVPIGAESYLTRVYGPDWNSTVRPHRWRAAHGDGFEPFDVKDLGARRAAGPFGPLPVPIFPSEDGSAL